MYKSKLRLLGVSALVGAGLIAAGPADAYNIRLGGVDIQIDNIASAGVSVRVADRETSLLPSANGGPEDLNGADNSAVLAGMVALGVVDPTFDCGTMENPSAGAMANGTYCLGSDEAVGDNFDGSINTDDGRLNFDNGDIIGGTFKVVSDITADFGAVQGFMRLNSFYDAVMSDDEAFERAGPTDDAKRDLQENIEVLDLYLDWNGELAGNPLQVRLGRQVINWGESTFYLGGNAVQPSVDVGALRRPGSEIREALLPVEALYGSLALPYDLTLEAYAGLGHEGYRLDVGGSPFANSDIANVGSGTTEDRAYIGGGRIAGKEHINCTEANRNATSTAIMGILTNAGLADCSVQNGVAGGYAQHSVILPVGNAEQARAEYGDPYFLTSVGDLDEPDGNDYGLALRWYSTALNSTEFALYYQNYTSQIPIVSTRSLGPVASWEATAAVGQTGRLLTGMGCGTDVTSAVFTDYFSGEAAGFEDHEGGDTPLEILTSLNNVQMEDQSGLLAAYRAEPTVSASIDEAETELASAGITTLNEGSVLEFQAMICGAYHSTGAESATAVSPEAANGMLSTGTVLPNISPKLELGFEYPEDIEMWGFSFNTTVLGWGIQGEVSYRPEAPLQIDTDELTIGALGGSCSGRSFVGLAEGLSWGSAGVTNGFGSADHFNATNTSCSDQAQTFHGALYDEATVFDIGTTATFTRSNPLVSLLGADLAILLTEFNMVNVPRAGDYKDGLDEFGPEMGPLAGRAAGVRGNVPLAGGCTSGTDIGLAALFTLDIRQPEVCRPTETASSGLILASLQFNNVFGSAWSLSPTLVYQEDLNGIAVRPVASFTEGNKRTSLSVSGSYQDTTVQLSYTDFGGDALYNRNIDKDFVALSVKRGF